MCHVHRLVAAGKLILILQRGYALQLAEQVAEIAGIGEADLFRYAGYGIVGVFQQFHGSLNSDMQQILHNGSSVSLFECSAEILLTCVES